MYVAKLAVIDMRKQCPRSKEEVDASIGRIMREHLSREDTVMGNRLGISIKEFSIEAGGVPVSVDSADKLDGRDLSGEKRGDMFVTVPRKMDDSSSGGFHRINGILL